MHTRTTAFTLIEVLVALAIISVALAAFVRVTSQSTVSLGDIEQRSLAMLAADNTLTELRIGILPATSAGAQTVACPQGELRLICRVSIDAPQEGLRAVSVDVYAERDTGVRLASLRTRLAEIRQ
ncbi:MAG: type II secretion system minor pseudopilin GspI [Rhodocyclaceae bacterium]